MPIQKLLQFSTKQRGLLNITDPIQAVVHQTQCTIGLCNLFLQHTSASLILCENADPVVQDDLERFISHLVPDGNPLFQHIAEGEDDMPAHVRTVLTQNSLTIPIANHVLQLGHWQGIYLWEHRTNAHFKRHILITIIH